MMGEQYLKSAFSYLFIGDYSHATAAFHQAMEANPQNPVFAFHGSVTALRNGDLDLAERWALRALANDSGQAIYVHHLARVRSQQDLRSANNALSRGDRKTAQELLERAIDRDPLNEGALALQNQLMQSIEEVEQT